MNRPNKLLSKKSFVNSEGYTLLETLVSFTIFGLFVILVLTFVGRFLFNPNTKLLKNARDLGRNEMSYCMANYIKTDTLYVNQESSLYIKRIIKKKDNNLINVIVKVGQKDDSVALVNYKTIYNNFE